MMNFKLNQSNFIKCVIALKLTWSHIIGIDWPVLQSDMYIDQSAVAQGHFYLWIDYDKSEVKENAFHCLWWQETKLFEKMSLLNGGMTWPYPPLICTTIRGKLNLGLFYWYWNHFFCLLCSLFSIFHLDSLWSWLWQCWEGLEILSPPPHKGTVICSVRGGEGSCLLKPFKLNPLRFG